MRTWIGAILDAFPAEQVYLDEPMARHTTMRVGGPADVLIEVNEEADVARALGLARAAGVPCMLLGNGSNMIVRDGGVRGMVVKLGEGFDRIRVEDTRVYAQAGAKLKQVGAVARDHHLTGFEFAHGIPGAVGGATAMNAGAYEGELRDILDCARVYVGDHTEVWSGADFQYGYRTSRALRENAVVLESVFRLENGDMDAIDARMRALAERRREKQPLNYPSAGSVFKRPEGHFAGALIERAGCKGLGVGGARVSEKHAGFIVNTNAATARDVLDLIDLVVARVRAHSGVTLECEVRVLGEE